MSEIANIIAVIITLSAAMRPLYDASRVGQPFHILDKT